MSKYYVELDDVIQRLDNAIYCANEGEFGYDEALKRLRIAYSETIPTIEVSEDVIGQGSGDIDWQAVTSTGQEIYAKGYEDGKKSVEVSEDCISREWLINRFKDIVEHYEMRIKRAKRYGKKTTYDTSEQIGYWKDEIADYKFFIREIESAPSVVPKPKEVIYGNEHNCIMTLFGECSYSETGCGDCAVVEKVRDALAKVQMKTQNSNENSKEGEWIKQGISPHEGIQSCSLCGAMYDITAEFDICPNCGAKMKGAENEN